MLLVGTLDWVYLVAILVLLRSTHVTLGIDRIIEAVAGRRRNSHTSLEHRAAFAHTHQGIETAIAPSPDTDVVLIHVWQTAHIERCLHLIL